MASIIPFGRKNTPGKTGSATMSAFLQGYSIEVMPRTAAKIDSFADLLPKGTRVYVAHIDGTPFEDMLTTAKRLVDEGFPVMPHFPARIIKDRAMLEVWIKSYSDVGVSQALLLGGGLDAPQGDFADSMQLLDTGLFDANGFVRLHVAGHPEGNKDIDPDGGEAEVMKALCWKNDFQDRTDAQMAIATQFCFEAKPVIDWANRLSAAGVTLPIHIGIAGPAKLQTLIRFSMACGVGPSLRVLKRRAADLTKLLLPFSPDEILSDLAAHKAANPDFNITNVHIFPLGGIRKSAEFVDDSSFSSNMTSAKA